MIERKEALKYLKSKDYLHLRSIYVNYKEGLVEYDEDIIECLRYFPELCFEYEVRTDLEYINNAKFRRLRYIPSRIRSFTKLKDLELTSNILSSLPNEFGHLISLEAIDLDRNKFTKFPSILTKLLKLKSINLKKNSLREIGELGNNLTYLRLSDNKPTSLFNSISNLIKLQYISLDGNPISKQEMEKIKNLLPDTTKIVF